MIRPFSFNPFPHDSDYDCGDANHLPIVPVTAEPISPDASQESTPESSPVPGDAGIQKESHHE
jgi:hypothetical protein